MTPQRPEIHHRSVAIEEGVDKAIREIGTAHHLVQIVDAAGRTVFASECAQILHFAAAVNERMLEKVPRAVCDRRPANGLSEVVDTESFAAAVRDQRSE